MSPVNVRWEFKGNLSEVVEVKCSPHFICTSLFPCMAGNKVFVQIVFTAHSALRLCVPAECGSRVHWLVSEKKEVTRWGLCKCC